MHRTQETTHLICGRSRSWWNESNKLRVGNTENPLLYATKKGTKRKGKLLSTPGMREPNTRDGAHQFAKHRQGSARRVDWNKKSLQQSVTAQKAKVRQWRKGTMFQRNVDPTTKLKNWWRNPRTRGNARDEVESIKSQDQIERSTDLLTPSLPEICFEVHGYLILIHLCHTDLSPWGTPIHKSHSISMSTANVLNLVFRPTICLHLVSDLVAKGLKIEMDQPMPLHRWTRKPINRDNSVAEATPSPHHSWGQPNTRVPYAGREGDSDTVSTRAWSSM